MRVTAWPSEWFEKHLLQVAVGLIPRSGTFHDVVSSSFKELYPDVGFPDKPESSRLDSDPEMSQTGIIANKRANKIF